VSPVSITSVHAHGPYTLVTINVPSIPIDSRIETEQRLNTQRIEKS